MIKNRNIRLTRILKAFGADDATVSESLSDFDGAARGIRIDLKSDFPETQIHLIATGHEPDRLNNVLDEACKWVANKIGDRVFALQGESMAEVVGQLLISRKATLAVAESCTGGLISSVLTDIPGSSNYFLFGGVTYSNQSKMDILRVAGETIGTFGAVHEETAKEMAAGVRLISGATYGISTSGIAGPEGGTPEKPVGTVCLGIATPAAAHGYRYCFPKANRGMNKKVFSMAALDLLRRELSGFERGRY